jgi:hypothetical protein
MKRLLIFALLMAPLDQAQAGTREDVLSGALRCGTIVDDRRWLDCFYGSAQPMRGQLGLSPAPVSQTALVPSSAPSGSSTSVSGAPVQHAERQSFWKRVLGGQVVLDKVSASSYGFDTSGYFTITLENGQVWRQQDSDPVAHWSKPAKEYLITITKGALNSYNLVVPGDANVYKVRRLR